MSPKVPEDASGFGLHQWLTGASFAEDDASESPYLRVSSDSKISDYPPSSSSSSSSKDPVAGRKRPKPDSHYELKNSQDALVGSISAVMNYLKSSGVPKPSIDQLQKNLDLGRYFAVLKRVQDYITCIPSASVDNALAKMHLTVTAWESLCRYKSTQYRIAYKFCFRLRYEVGAPAEEVEKALSMQIQFAEQCTACQKKLYIVRNWQTRQLHQMKRKSRIEAAQGCKAIQCT